MLPSLSEPGITPLVMRWLFVVLLEIGLAEVVKVVQVELAFLAFGIEAVSRNHPEHPILITINDIDFRVSKINCQY